MLHYHYPTGRAIMIADVGETCFPKSTFSVSTLMWRLCYYGKQLKKTWFCSSKLLMLT